MIKTSNVVTLSIRPDKMEEIRDYAREKKMPYSKILVEAFDQLKAREKKEKMGPDASTSDGPVSNTSESVPNGETPHV